METRTYDEMRSYLKTGDLVLFSGKGGISEWIKWFSKSTWSHVGMILKSVDWNVILLWESTSLSSVEDVELGRAIRGVQLVPFSARLANYRGRVAVRKLSHHTTPDMEDSLCQFRSEVRARPYEKNYIELAKAAYDGPFGGNVEDLSSLFCSELIAEAYQRMGLLTEGKPSNEYTPRDFSTEAKHALELQGGRSLGTEIEIAHAKRIREADDGGDA